jgi:hypothetical protein
MFEDNNNHESTEPNGKLSAEETTPTISPTIIEQKKNVRVISKDKKSFLMTKNAARLSNVMMEMLGDNDDNNEKMETGGEEEEQVFPCYQVESTELDKAIEFMEYYVNNPMNKIVKVFN